MTFVRLFPRAMPACFVLCLLCSVPAFAQDGDITRPRSATTAATSVGRTQGGAARLENEITLAREEEEDEPMLVREGDVRMVSPAPARTPLSARGAPGEQIFRHMLTTAIEERLGTPYRLGTAGPYRYDCSGFVWSVFQAAGVEFERSSARSLWERFAPAREDERYKFGTLVFFNHLGHVGIVVDGTGFYHASSSRGVVYSPFNEYWSSRIVGFRRIPLPESGFVAANK
ncbi:MAG TPA: C40 family peptidase [Pyrinomonadaceae bacterium]|nr:C40 family peptidase [Pyrinomonadaceae bacterium]